MNITSVTLEITNTCNLHCKHCYNESGPSKKHQEMDLDILRSFLLDIKEHNQAKLDEMWVSGGEPVLHQNFQAVIALLFSFGYQPIIATNGILDEASLKRVIDVKSYIRRVHISLEGIGKVNDAIRVPGGFEHVIHKTIPTLKSEGVHVCVTIHLRKSNQNQIPDMAELIIDQLDCDLKFGILRPIGRAQRYLVGEMLTPNELYECIKTIYTIKNKYHRKRIWHDWDILSNEIKFYTQNYQGKSCCPAGLQTTLTCASDFAIYPCSQLRADVFNLGNFRTEKSLEKIFSRQHSERIGKLLSAKDNQCAKCSYYQVSCQGGCPAVAYGLKNNISALTQLDPYCFARLID